MGRASVSEVIDAWRANLKPDAQYIPSDEKIDALLAEITGLLEENGYTVKDLVEEVEEDAREWVGDEYYRLHHPNTRAFRNIGEPFPEG